MTLYKGITSCISINGHLTKEFNIRRGVRQGCPLSMLMYVLFQEPLYQAIDKNSQILPISIPNQISKAIGYADDTTLYIVGDNLPEMQRLMQEAIDKSVQWAENLSLKFDPAKTKAMIFHKREKDPEIEYPANLKLEGEEVEYVTELKILGVWFDPELKWNAHVDKKIEKCRKLIM